MVWWWFGANMAGQRNKNAFKFLLILLILSQKHIIGVKKVVWDGLDVVWGGLEWFWVFWGGLGCFHGPLGYPRIEQGRRAMNLYCKRPSNG